jgi:hypothetical protein
MHRPVTTILTVAVAVTLFAAGGGVAAAAEDGGGGYFDRLVEDNGDPGITWDDARRFVLKLVNVDRTIEDLTTGPEPVTEHATEFTDTYNQNNATIEADVNEQLNASTDFDVFRIQFHNKDGDEATRYLVADVENDSFTNTRVVDQAEFDDLNRSVDYTVEADWYVSRHAASELEAYVTDYAETDEDLTRTDKAKLIAKYGGGLTSDLWGDTLNESDT